jgi:iron-regulated transporter 1
MPWLARVRPELPTNSIPPGTIWFCIFGTFAALSEFALEISLWKRWLPLTVRAQLAQSGSAGSMKFEEPLATANARMRRITMTIDIGMPLLVGWLLSSRGDVLGSILVARLGAMLLAMQLGALYIASKTCARGESSSVTPASSVTEMQVTTKERDITANGDMITERQVSKFLAAARVSYQRLRGLFSSWRLYYEQKVFVASLAHVSLYFTVLSPGGLLFGFLTYCGVSGRIIGLFRAASAVMGILATFSFEILVSRMHRSVLAVGRLGVVCQLACLLPALLLLWLVPVPGEPLQSATTPGLMPRLQPSIVLVGALLFVVLSRWGLWCWDSAETEIMQTMVDAHAVSEVSAVEAALCALAELVMYSVSLVFSNPRKFPVLATMSALSVSTGAIIFHRWTKLQDRREEHPQGTVAESPAPNESPV